jgi:FtsZ-binding cell division protein ZapB
MSEQPPESPRLNALGKPLSPSYDPNYKIKTPLSSINRLRRPMPPGVLRVPMNPDEEQRWKAVKACIAKGEKAERKAKDFYITAGQYLKELKAEHTGTWFEWEIKLKERAGIGKSRASELMQIADGTKTVEQVRADTAERTAKTRALQSSPLRSGENADDPEVAAEARKIEAVTDEKAAAAAKSESETEQPRRRTRLERELDAGAFNRLRDEQAHNEDLAEKLRAAEIKIAGLESEVEELKEENARLRAELEAKHGAATEGAVMPKRGRGRPPRQQQEQAQA